AGTAHPPIDEDSSLFAGSPGLRTSASSAVAVKSTPSISNFSNPDEPSPSEERQSLLRPTHRRRTSVKQQQDRQLFTRRARPSEDLPERQRTDDEGSEGDPSENTQQWLRLSRQQNVPPPQILDDPDNLPPPTNGSTG